MISVSNVSMRFGSKILFEEVTVTFSPGRRYGLTGPNGAGKSTFMKVLSGELDPQKGTVVRPKKIGLIRQDQFAFDAYRVIDVVVMGNARLWSALQERELLYAKADLTDADGIRLGELVVKILFELCLGLVTTAIGHFRLPDDFVPLETAIPRSRA